jgi:hypothetical protein
VCWQDCTATAMTQIQETGSPWERSPPRLEFLKGAAKTPSIRFVSLFRGANGFRHDDETTAPRGPRHLRGRMRRPGRRTRVSREGSLAPGGSGRRAVPQRAEDRQDLLTRPRSVRASARLAPLGQRMPDVFHTERIEDADAPEAEGPEPLDSLRLESPLGAGFPGRIPPRLLRSDYRPPRPGYRNELLGRLRRVMVGHFRRLSGR